MRRISPFLVASVVLIGATASAQEVDLTFTQPPVVMLAIDSSGSMQWRGTGIIRDDRSGISCQLSSTDKSREIVVKEVLTGTFEGYTLNTISANSNSSYTSYECNVGEHQPLYSSQANDGLLDTYAERLRFAFSTFDSVSRNYNNGTSVGGQPDWSYPGTSSTVAADGRVRRIAGESSYDCSRCSSGESCVRYSGTYDRYYCLSNVGIRSESGNPCSGDGCLISSGTPGSALDASNATIQEKVLATRSTGGTPIAAALKDIRYWFDNHPDVKVDASSSSFLTCRRFFTLLVTDGVPNNDCAYSNASTTRPEVCFRFGACYSDSDCPSEWSCVNGACQHAQFNEPTLASVQRAADLFNPPASSGPYAKSVKVHVIGFDSPSALKCEYNSDCPFGQQCVDVVETDGDGNPVNLKRCSCVTDANCDVGQTCEDVSGGVRQCRLGGLAQAIAAAGGGQALFATDPVSLRTAMNQIFASLLPETTSRTRPTSTPNIASLEELPSRFPEPSAEALFLFQGAFTVPGDSPHWRGFLQRVSIGNIGTADSPVIGPITQATGVHGSVRFDELLNTQPKPVDDQGVAYDRKIYTYKNGEVVEFTKSNISPTDLGVGTTAERDQVVDFIRGEVGTARATNRLGAIYHSSPVILDPPVLEIPLASYKVYQADSRIRKRPPMVFVGSNLGMLHAFNAQTGKEEWAFIPPILLGTAKNHLTGFTWGVDSSPVARDIQLTTVNAESDSLRNWRAVVAMGLGQGGRAVIALDVTDPTWRADNDPPFKMLWQFDNTVAGGKLGIPYASPTIGTAFLDHPSQGLPFQERAIVIVPGGKTPTGDASDVGRHLWVLDLITGMVLKKLNGPDKGGMTGTCAAIDDFPGNFITRVFCGDASGKLTKLNLANQDVSKWTSEEVFFDLYQGADGTKVPIYNPPALASRANGNLMIIFGNGDPNDLQSTESSRMAFIEEVPVFDQSSGALTGFTADLRKLVVFSGGEKLTGSPVVANNVAYFTTFLPDTSDTCAFGRTRLWGVLFDQFTGDGDFIAKLQSTCGPDGTFDTADDTAGTTESCLLPTGSVSFGFDLVRTPSTASFSSSSGSTSGDSSSSTSTDQGGELKLVFQTGTALLNESSSLRDTQLTPPGSQTIQVGAINIPDLTSRTRVLSWGRVLPF